MRRSWPVRRVFLLVERILPIAILAMAVVGRYRRHGVSAVTALVGTLLLMFVFMKIVYLSLPLGVGPFETISLALMRLMGIR